LSAALAAVFHTAVGRLSGANAAEREGGRMSVTAAAFVASSSVLRKKGSSDRPQLRCQNAIAK